MLISRINLHAILIAISGIIGFLGLSSIPRFATLILAVPALWCLASSRRAAFGVILAYFLAVSRGLLPGAAVFLSEHHTLFQATALYILMPLGISLPFLALWSHDKYRKALCLPLASSVAFVLPPLSLIGIVNPILAAGTIFKGFGLPRHGVYPAHLVPVCVE